MECGTATAGRNSRSVGMEFATVYKALTIVEVEMDFAHDCQSWNGVWYRYLCKELTIVEVGMEFAHDRRELKWSVVQVRLQGIHDR